MPPGVDSSSLREALRILWFASETGIGEDGKVDITSIIRLCRDRAGISGFSPNPALGIRFLVSTGLAEETRGGLVLTQAGVHESLCAKEPTVMNEVQRDYMLGHLIANRTWGPRLRSILILFRADDSGRFVFSKSLHELSEEEDETLRLLQLVNAVEVEDEVLVLSSDALASLVDYMHSWLPISQSQLDRIISERRRLADIAEDYILEWEKKRLEHAGFPQLRSLVRKVSSIDVSRGYDIHSVDGDGGSDTDRYIEVKSSVGCNLSFFWTSREMEVATQYRERYWIYFVPRVHLLPEDCTILMIQDPIRFKDTLFELNMVSAFVKGEPLMREAHSVSDLGDGRHGLLWTLSERN